jgi:hypothetical protein
VDGGIKIKKLGRCTIDKVGSSKEEGFILVF